MEEKIVFISGGARSGKTSFAESYAEKIFKKSTGNLYYLATSEASDREMDERIKRHQKDRAKSDADWQTIEQAKEIGKIAKNIKEHSIVLVDCLTLLLSNELYQADFNEKEYLNKSYQREVKDRVLAGLLKIASKSKVMLLVSNEVLNDLSYSDNPFVLIYQRLLGEIHQEIVKLASEAYLLESGIAIQKK